MDDTVSNVRKTQRERLGTNHIIWLAVTNKKYGHVNKTSRRPYTMNQSEQS